MPMTDIMFVYGYCVSDDTTLKALLTPAEVQDICKDEGDLEDFPSWRAADLVAQKYDTQMIHGEYLTVVYCADDNRLLIGLKMDAVDDILYTNISRVPRITKYEELWSQKLQETFHFALATQPIDLWIYANTNR